MVPKSIHHVVGLFVDKNGLWSVFLLAGETADLTLGLRPLGLSPGSQGSAAWLIEIFCAFENLRRAHPCGGCRNSGRKGSRRQVTQEVACRLILYLVLAELIRASAGGGPTQGRELAMDRLKLSLSFSKLWSQVRV